MIQLASSWPLWGIALAAVAVVVVAWAAYHHVAVPLSRRHRAVLTTLRAVTLLLLLLVLLRPVRVLPPDAARDAVVPILLDTSASMRLADMDGERRIERATAFISGQLVPELSKQFTPEWLAVGDGLAPVVDGHAPADAPRSDLAGALRAVRERFRDRKLAGIVLVTDGGDTSGRDVAAAVQGEPVPVFTVGVGAPEVAHDREVLSVAAGQAPLGDALVDLTVTAVSHGYGTTPIELHVLANGRPVDVRRVTPAADGSPVQASFTLPPDRDGATVFTVEVPPVAGELVAENNRRSMLVNPSGRKRRLLLVEGAPGFEHAFLKRALSLDPGLEVDSVIRKGKNELGGDTYFVQAASSRTASLVGGFPPARESLFQYDGVILANVEGDYFKREQLDTAAAFVGERGGGLLVMGARSFAQQGFASTALEDVLPVDVSDRRGAVVQASRTDGGDQDRIRLTRDGETFPMLRIGDTPADAAKRWAALPPLPGGGAVGGPRPGAQVLATTTGPGGAVRPVIAVQRFGAGRAMVFTAEASWRWRMQLPSDDRTYERLWRQVARWLTADAPDPVHVTPTEGVLPGTGQPIDVLVRDAAFRPVRDADVTVRLTVPGGEVRELRPVLADASTGRYAAPARFDTPGVYRLEARARRGDQVLGDSQRWVLAGGANPEITDPRLNEDLLRRVAFATGGQYARLSDAGRIAEALRAVRSDPGTPVVQDAWQTPWLLAAILLLLSAEWTLRRSWGLR